MRFARLAACFAALAILFSSAIEANAAGALATGQCGAFGYAFDDVSPEAAALRARAQCKGKRLQGGHELPPHLRGVRDRRRAMPAGRTAGRKRRQSRARAEHRERAVPSLRRRTCVIRAWVCDQKG